MNVFVLLVNIVELSKDEYSKIKKFCENCIKN